MSSSISSGKSSSEKPSLQYFKNSSLSAAGTAVTSHIIAKHHYNKLKNAPEVDLDDLEERMLKVEKEVESFEDTVTFDEGERSLDD